MPVKARGSSTGGFAAHRQFYGKNYYVRYESKPPIIEPYLREIFHSLIAIAATEGRKLTALDVGCGIGRNIGFLDSQGVVTLGIDISQYAAKSSKQVRASGAHIPVRSASLDLITAIHFVEHLSPGDFTRFLWECNRLLRSNGVLFIITPNGLSPVHFFLRKRFFFDPTHVFFSNPLSLGGFLKSSGFSDWRLRFNIRLSLRRGHVLRDLILFVFTSSHLAYLRNVLHVATRKAS